MGRALFMATNVLSVFPPGEPDMWAVLRAPVDLC